MEEDTRSYHRFHPFRSLQYHRVVSELTPAIGTGVGSDATAGTTGAAVTQLGVSSRGTSRSPVGGSKRSAGTAFGHSDPPSFHKRHGFDPFSKYRDETGIVNGNSNNKTNKPVILGMTAVDEFDQISVGRVDAYPSLAGAVIDGYYNTRLSAGNNEQQQHSSGGGKNDGGRHRPRPPRNQRCAAAAAAAAAVNDRQDDRASSLIEETRRLLQDYQRRFHRQTLTDRAQELFDRAVILATKGRGNHLRQNRNGVPAKRDDGDDDDGDDDEKILPASIALCTEALALCRTSIADQEAATMHDTAVVGGSYLLTGDIRLRRGAEALKARIHGSRAALLYQAHRHEEALLDCDAALALRKQRAAMPRGGGRRTAVPPPVVVGRFGSHGIAGGNHENPETTVVVVRDAPERHDSMPLSAAPSPPAITRGGGGPTAPAAPVVSSAGVVRSLASGTTEKRKHKKKKEQQQQQQQQQRRRGTLKRLCLLRGRVLSALGRHRVAADWLLHHESTVRSGEVAVHRFLHRLSVRSRSVILNDDDDGNGPVAARPETEGVKHGEGGGGGDGTTIPSDARLWPRLISNIDRRLGEGMPGRMASGGRGKNGASAIYRMLRHGPVLFHHHHHQKKRRRQRWR